MIWLWIAIAFIFGFGVGEIFTVYLVRKSDKESVQDGIIELNGKLYLLKEFEL